MPGKGFSRVILLSLWRKQKDLVRAQWLIRFGDRSLDSLLHQRSMLFVVIFTLRHGA